MHTHAHACIHSLPGQVAQSPVFGGGLQGIRTGTKKALRPDVARRSPLLRRPHRLPLFMRRLNEAAGAAEMNQSPAWAWEGRRTGRPAWSLGGDQQGKACRGGVAMPPGGNGAAVLLSCPPPGSCPPPLSASGRATTTLRPSCRGGPAGARLGGVGTAHLGTQTLSWDSW